MKDVEYKCICCTYFQLIAWKWSKPETNTAFWIIKNPFSLKAKYCCDILIYTFTLCLSMPYRQSERKTFTQVLKHSIYLELLAWHLFFFFFSPTPYWVAITLHLFFTTSFFFCPMYLSFVFIYIFHLSISSLCLELVANCICDAQSFQSACLDIILCNRDYRKNWFYCLFCVIDSSPFQN